MREVEDHQRLVSRDVDDCIVPIRGWSATNYFSQHLHVYIEYAPFGSLNDSIKKFQGKKGQEARRPDLSLKSSYGWLSETW
jgi:hypothetical protein